jgi:CSLREA domain-containing protein
MGLTLCLVLSLMLSTVTVPAVSAAGSVAAPLAQAATFTVNSTIDRSDANPGNGVCQTSTAGQCTLRAAIQEANSSPGADTISLPAGVYEIQIPTVNEDLDGTGDFDIHSSVTIVGAGASATLIDGGWPLPGADPTARGLDRLFEIHPTAGNVTFRNVTLREGYSVEDGGAIQNWSSGLLRLENVHVRDSYAGGAGGGINNADPADYEWVVEPLVPPKSGRVEIVNSTLSGNAAGSGAAVNNTSTGTVSILAGSRVVDNPGLMIPDPAQVIDPLDPEPIEYVPAPGVYEPNAGAITNQGATDTVGTIRIADSTVSGNFASANGAGILNEGSGILIIERSTIVSNTTEAGGGGLYTGGGVVTVINSMFSANVAHDGGGIYSNGSVDSVGLRPRFTLSGSTISGNTSHASGGGLYNGGEAQLTISDVTFSGNKASDAGGGLNTADRSSATLTRVTFTGNEANGEGGGAWTGSERLVSIADSTFTANHAGVPTAADIADPAGANIAGGGGMYSENGPLNILRTTFASNTATDEGGGLSLDNFGDVTISDSTLRDNRAGTDGGGVENSGRRVTFERLLITNNRAELDGGGIYNSSSGVFTIVDTTVQLNSGASGGGLANAPDNDLVIRSSLFLRNTARTPRMSEEGIPEEGGHGGGIFSLADGDALIENTTISGNTAATGGGGLFHDADGLVKLVNNTIWRNSAPRGGGIGVAESDFVPTVPPQPNIAVVARNTIIGGSLRGGSCDWYITSEGGNLDGLGTQDGTSASGGAVLSNLTYCFLSAAPNSDLSQPALRDRRSASFTVDAIADNGGPTLSHALRWGSLAIDAGVSPCVETDQRGVTRPQNGRCDIGAYEFAGDPPPPDDTPPDTEFRTGPTQDDLETVAFTFVGTDDLTPASELQFECRLIEADLTEPPEPLAPWDPVPPEFWWVGCTSPWQAPLTEEGLFTFEVRAIDRAGNVDDTPATHIFSGSDTNPPETIIAEAPSNPSNSRTATFTFTGIDNLTPPQFLEFECRLDSRDPDLWLECFNPVMFSNLTSGAHTIEVRAIDGHENIDPTPARYTWIVGQLPNCDAANITLTAAADAWVDEVTPLENYLFHTELTVRSGSVGDPTAVPPEPVVGQNARALFRFDLLNDAPDCQLESATLRLYNESPTEGRILEAIPIAGSWRESTVTWFNQPGTLGSAVTAASRNGYQEWDVTAHVLSMLESGVNYGWQIRDAAETDPDGGDQAFASREVPQDPPDMTLPLLVLRYEADASPPPPPPVPATVPTAVYCGQVLTESTLVANDLTNCPGEGLVIGASNIVVDLGGHTIDGPNYLLGNVSGQEEGFPAGIRVSGKTNVVIRNGTVQEFGWGVLLTAGTTRTVVENLTILRNAVAGVELFDADDGRTGNTIRGNTINDNELGVQLIAGSENSVVISNTIHGNLGEQLFIQFSDGHRIEGNEIVGIPTDPTLDSDGGVLLEGASDNVFFNNLIRDTGDAGIVINAGSDNNRIEDNVMTRNGDAGVIVSDSDRNQMIGNVAHQESDGGIVLNNAHDSVVRGNDLRFNPSGVEAGNTNNLVVENNDGSDSLQAGFELGNGLNMRIVDNTANRTGGSGISLEGGAFDTNGLPVGGALIEGNTTNENAGDGITVADGGHTIRNNTAHHNAGFGILAGETPNPGEPPSGTNIDGGGNVASGNAEPEQCVGVVCGTGGAPPLTPPDVTAPDTSITGSPFNPTGSTSATFTFSANDGPNGTPLTAMVFECRLDPPPDPLPEVEPPDVEPPDPGAPPDPPDPPETLGWGECISPVHYRGLEPGAHHFEVRAIDQAEVPNVDLTPASYDWVIDVTLEEEGTGPDSIEPSTRIADAPTNPTTSTSATFRFAGSDNSTPGLALFFECQIDGQGFESCTTPQTYSGLGVGSHTFEVRAIDRATTPNVDSTPASYTWEILITPADLTPPDTTIGSGPDAVTVLTSATFTFFSNDPTATYECSMDGGVYALCASPHTATGLAVGARTFSVRAVDPAANVDATPATFAWTISAPPVPRTVYCGQVLTQSTLVNNDLVDCLWDGLVIGANGITIDLNGKTIDGKGLAAGIRNDGYDNVAIKNGTVVDFDYGVMLNPGTERNIIDGVTLLSNQEAGIALGQVPHPLDPTQPFPPPPPPTYQAGVRDNILRNNTLMSNDAGVWLTNGTRGTLVRGNDMAANSEGGVLIERSSDNHVETNSISASSEAGVGLIGSSGNTILGNLLTENGGGVYLGATDSSSGNIPSDDNLVENNAIAESGGPAIEVAGSSNSTLSGNQIIDNVAHASNGEGVSLYHAAETLVRGNDLRGNKGGIALSNSSGNRLETNNTSESDGDGISLQALSLNNDVIENISSNNTSDGITVADETPGDLGMLLDGNTTHNNIGYGIYVSKVSHVIKNNTANGNGTWGIYAGDPSNGRSNVDGGGNRGQGNLGPLDPLTQQPLQCHNVVCDGSDVPPDPIPPDTLILQGPPDPSTDSAATFTFNGSDNVGSVTFECRIDGGAFTACASPQAYTLGDGPHTFEVRAVDISGNVDATPAIHAWTISSSPGAPETTITSGPDYTTVRTDATFEFSASKSGSAFECALDGSAFALCTSPQTYTGLPVGVHTFQVRAIDQSNHTDTTPAAYTWSIGPAPVSAQVGCGEIIVQSTRVLNDLIDCGGFGLIIGAPGITIDLDGHVIDGVGLDAGILNNGYDSVTIMNGTVTQFDYGILLNPGTARNVVDAMRLESNAEAGIMLSDADQNGQGNTIRNNAIVANSVGIWLASNTRHTLVRGNALGGNAADGIRLEFASENRLEANEIARSGGHGIVMVSGGDNSVVDNIFSTNGGFGIAAGEELLPSNNNRIERNTISGGQGGVSVVDSIGNQVLYNDVNGTTGPGVALDLTRSTLVLGNDLSSSASGIAVSESSGNRIEANNASSTLGTGIAIEALSYNNVVVQNTASQNGGEGIAVEDAALAGQGNLLDRNIANGNGGDGIGVHGVGHTLAGNTAQLNGGWGIYVAVGATDGGGNFAAGNAEPAQCYGIVCTIGTVPGAPETWIVSGPPATSNSRNASFFYMGSDNATPLHELVFECRLDTTNDLAWEDCEYPAEYLNLSAGPHVFEVRAVDQLGAGLADPTPARHEWTYVPLPAGVAPTTIIDIAPDAQTWAFDAIFTFHSNEPDVTFECRVDQFGYEPCGFEGALYMSQGAFEWGLTETEVGPHTFYVRAIDFEGNVGTPATYTWQLLGIVTTFTDGPGFTPGETPFDPPTGGEVMTTTATLDFIANVGDATYECSLDLEPFAPCTPPVTYIGLTPGDHMLRVVATDAAGFSELEAAVFEWGIVEALDVTPPDTSIERAPANNSSSTIFEFAGVDNLTPPALLTFECRVDSTNELDWFACVSPFNLLDIFTYQDVQMAPGQHTFEVRAIDIAEPLDPNSTLDGNVDPTPASYTWTMVADTTPPGTGILSGPAATVGEGEILFEFFGADNATPVLEIMFECSVDVGPFEPCTSPESVQGLAPGAHLFSVRAVDLAGNVDPTPAIRMWTIVPAPVTTITSGPAGQIVDGNPPALPSTTENAIFVFSTSQPGSTFECSLDGADFASCVSPYAVWIVESGTHEFEVRATNPEGVVEEPPASYEWLVELGSDITPPNTSITAMPPNPDSSSVATFSFTGTDNRTPTANLTFECALDGTAYNSCVAPQQFSDLTHGSHTMLIRARDAAGNFDPTPASYTWIVELPPVTTILTGPEEVTENTSATFTFEANVPGSTFQCWLDGVITACTSPVSYTGLAAGDHLFAVLATGPAGTVELAWAEWEWTIADITPPITTIESGPAIQTEVVSATFVFSANEPVTTFMCSLDGSTPQPCTSPKEYPFLHPGLHRFEVVGLSPLMFDQYGQPIDPLFDPIPAIYEWTIVDLAPPDTTIMYGPAATTGSTTAYFGFSSDDPTAIVECSLNGAGFSSCETPTEFADLLPGSYTLVARAVDLAGNVDPTPETYNWTIVELAPNTPVGANVTVELPLPNGGGTATLTFFEVAATGVTTLDELNGAPPLPAGYVLAGGRYYDISTTADYSEPATLCIPFDPQAFPNQAVRLLHFDGSMWIDVTTLSDPAGMVCGQPEGFSPFALAAGSGIAPLASIISGPPNPSNSGAATFTFWADVPDSLVLCSIDGLPFAPCTSPVTYYYLETGDHEFMVQAVGPDGQMQLIPSLYEWEIVLGPDTVPPDTTITLGAPALTVNYISNFEFAGTDDQTAPIDLEFECSLDGGLFEGCEPPEQIEVLTAGAHTLAVRAIDLAGNADPTPATHNWTVVDMSAPDTSIELGPDSETELTSATFEFIGEEPDGTPVTAFDCSLDNADFAACTSPHAVTGLSSGPHVFQVRAVDPAGVVDPTPDFYEWLIIGPADTTPPDTFIVAGPPIGNSGPDVIFGFASNEPVETYECSLDGGPYETCEAVYELLGLAQGQHTLLVRAIDIAEIPNVDPSPASYTWTTLGEPDTTILSGPTDPSASYSATFAFSSDQAGATFQCSVDGSPYVPCTSPFIAGPLVEEGTHDFEVRAVNQFVNIDGEQIVDLTPATYEWTIQDVEPPNTTITSVTFLGPTDLIEPNSFRFTFTGEDNRTAWFELSFECSLDGGLFEGCSTPHYILLEELAGGTHELQVRAVDDIGNVDPTPASYTWSVEGEPETTILTGPAAQTESTEATFTFSSDQASATFECSLDLALFSACTSPVTLANVPYGAHEFQVRARSLSGAYVDLTPAVYAWESGDMTPPVVTILSGPPITTTDTTATITFSVDDPAALLQCSLNGAPLVFCTSPVTYTNLAAGDHALEVEATKPNLLVEGVAAIWEWTVEDLTPPETTIVSGPPAEIGLGTPALFTFASNEPDAAFECSLDGAAFAECAAPPDNTAEFNAAAGAHTLLVRAVDPSLNVDATPESYSWTVVGPPLTTILAGPGATTNEITATFSFSADQPGVTFACALDGANFTPCTSPLVYPNLTFDSHLFEVQATNGFGVVELSPVSYAWTIVDETAPETAIDSGPAATTSNTSATFSFSSNELGVSFECALDGAAFAGCSSPQTYAGLSVASHTFAVRAIDAAGNVDATPASASWTIVPPPPPNTPTGTNVTVVIGSVTVTFASVTTEGLTTVSALGSAPTLPGGYLQTGALYYDVSTTAVFTAPVSVCFTYAPGSVADPVRLLHFDGTTWSDVTTTNDPLAGSVCGVTSSLSPFAIATATAAVVPDTTIESGPPAFTASTSADFAFSSNDPSATFECALDDLLDWGSCTATATFTGLTVGQHNLLVRAKNITGTLDATPASYQWTVTPLPETFIDSMPADPTESTDATFAFSSDQPGVTFECALDDAPVFLACTSPLTYTGLALGEHDFFVRARDAAGNVDTTPADHSWEIGDIPAPVTIASGPSATTSDTSATFVFSADEPNPTYECALDSATYSPCASPKTYSGLPLGIHTFLVRILNPTAVAEPPITAYEWTVEEPTGPAADTTPPETTIDSGPAASTSDTSATFAFSADEPGSTFECALDGAAFAACTTPAEHSGLVLGNHTFEVRAIDVAGNIDATPASYTWTIVPPPDTTAPETTIGSGPAATTTNTSASFTFSSSEAGSTFECSRDGAPFTTCSSPQAYTGLTVGSHTFQVRATDAAGNTDPTPATYSWTISAPPNCGSPITASANADAWIDQNSSTSNKGIDSILKVQGKSSNNNMRALVRFALPTTPAGCVLQAATLRMYAASWTNGRTLQALRVNAAWTENGVTWSNQPATTGTAATTTSGSGFRQWTVTSQVQAMYSGANNGFLIRDATENNGSYEQQFHSREKGSNMPQLVITFAPAP